jgi:monoamine oxidase
MSKSGDERVDVVVVGAGYAGLVTARALSRSGLSVAVLEAHDRVGGRVHTVRTATGHAVDLGGQWIGPGHRRMGALAREYSAATFRTHSSGAKILADGRWRRRSSEGLPLTAPLVSTTAALALFRLGRLAEQVRPDRPWETPDAQRLDTTTFGTWLHRQVLTPRARRLIDVSLSSDFGGDVAPVSLLSVLTAIRASGGLRTMLGVDGGSQQDLFVDGADRPARAIAAELGDAIRLRCPVEAIQRDDADLVVVGPTAAVRCTRVVVAVPPAGAARIRYEPALPAARDHLTQRVPMGNVYKVIAVYDEPFWRAAGDNGEAVVLDGPVATVFDTSHPGGPGHLCGLASGAAAYRLAAMPADRRRQAVTAAFADVHGPAAARPREWHEKVWVDDEWIRGAYSGIPVPGTLTSVGAALVEPVDRIHWAGTETATEWPGYIEGAVQSGERAAREVTAAIGTPVDGAPMAVR